MARRRSPDEDGAILILALVFVVACSAIVLGLLNLNGNDLLNTGSLRSQRGLEYAVDGAVDAAMQSIRYNGEGTTGSQSAPTACLSSAMSINTYDIAVECGGTDVSGIRTVYFYACQVALIADSTCSSANPLSKESLLDAEAQYDDVASGQTLPQCGGGVTTSCGESMSVVSWVVESANS